jgi:hypothetical protein
MTISRFFLSRDFAGGAWLGLEVTEVLGPRFKFDFYAVFLSCINNWSVRKFNGLLDQ